MPELPEIEHLRRTLEPILVGRTIDAVQTRRRDVIRPQRGRRIFQRAVLAGDRIAGLHRHGKQLALEGESGPVICVHLGMSGQLRVVEASEELHGFTHVHCIWTFRRADGSGCAQLVFRDPRRFGGLWLFETMDDLRRIRWGALGPDALDIRASALTDVCGRTHRPIKSVLLDQRSLAGVGNIYADEALFRAKIDPRTPAADLSKTRILRLGRSIREVLRQSVERGGTTFRDYVDGNGRPGRFKSTASVYGRSGKPCKRCGNLLEHLRLAGRTTVRCAVCQV